MSSFLTHVMIESWVVFVQNYTDRQSQKPLIHIKVIACSCFLTQFEDLKNTVATNEYRGSRQCTQAVVIDGHSPSLARRSQPRHCGDVSGV